MIFFFLLELRKVRFLAKMANLLILVLHCITAVSVWKNKPQTPEKNKSGLSDLGLIYYYIEVHKLNNTKWFTSSSNPK